VAYSSSLDRQARARSLLSLRKSFSNFWHINRFSLQKNTIEKKS
jgi:hypothetical protein